MLAAKWARRKSRPVTGFSLTMRATTLPRAGLDHAPQGVTATPREGAGSAIAKLSHTAAGPANSTGSMA